MTVMTPDDILDPGTFWVGYRTLDDARASVVGTELTVDGSNRVSQWNDFSGNGKHVVQANTSLMPLYTTPGSGSTPEVTFDGTDDYLQLASGLGMVGPVSVFCVNRRSTGTVVTGAIAHISTSNASEADLFGVSQGSSTNVSFRYQRNGSSGSTGYSNNPGSSNAKTIGLFRETTSNYAIWDLGTWEGDYSGGAVGLFDLGDSFDTLTLGSNFDGSDGSTCNIKAIIFVEGELTTRQAWQLFAYLGYIGGTASLYIETGLDASTWGNTGYTLERDAIGVDYLVCDDIGQSRSTATFETNLDIDVGIQLVAVASMQLDIASPGDSFGTMSDSNGHTWSAVGSPLTLTNTPDRGMQVWKTTVTTAIEPGDTFTFTGAASWGTSRGGAVVIFAIRDGYTIDLTDYATLNVADGATGNIIEMPQALAAGDSLLFFSMQRTNSSGTDNVTGLSPETWAVDEIASSTNFGAHSTWWTTLGSAYSAADDWTITYQDANNRHSGFMFQIEPPAPGGPDVSGTATGAFAMGQSAAAEVIVKGTATGAIAMAGTVPAKVIVKGTATGAFTMGQTADGLVIDTIIQGTADQALSMGASAAAKVIVEATATQSFTMGGDAAGLVITDAITGTATGSFTLSASAAAKTIVKASADQSLSLSAGAAVAEVIVEATTVQILSMGQSALGKIIAKATATQSFALRGTAIADDPTFTDATITEPPLMLCSVGRLMR